MSDREGFEKWAKDGFQLGKGCDGYLSAFTSSAFRAWQARQPEIDALKGKLNSCVDTGCRIASGKERLKNEIAALKAENERLREAAERATPPAQEDEPIFHTNDVCLISEWMDEVVVRREKDSQHNIPLYTRPDNSALRKAAAEVWDLFDSGHANNELMQCALKELSAALEGK